MPRSLGMLMLVSTVGMLSAVESSAYSQTPETLRALGEVRALSDKVTAFRANIAVNDKPSPQEQEQVTTSTLTASKQHGWRIRSSSQGNDYEFICDFSTFYQFYPGEKRVYKHVPGPEAQTMLRKPVTDLNPLNLLDVSTLKFQGSGVVEGEPVYHFEGTTTTQFLPQGKPVQRKMEAWISTKDGLPRKTIESVGPAVGTTVYSNVEINPQIDPNEFKFTPPAGVQVVDATAQMKAMEEQQRKAETQRKQAPAAAQTPTAPSSATPPAGTDERPKD